MTETATAGPPTESTAAERRREQRGWYFYDWANSVFSTSVLTVFLGPYLTEVAEAAADSDGYVHPLGLPVRAGAYFAYSVSASVLLAVLVMPLVAAVADRTGRKKPLLGGFAYLGAAATTGMFFLSGDRYLLGGALLVVANVAFGAAVVVYHAFLPADRRTGRAGRGVLPRLGVRLRGGRRWCWWPTWRCSWGTTRSGSRRARRCGSAWPPPACGGACSRWCPLRRLRDRPVAAAGRRTLRAAAGGGSCGGLCARCGGIR